MLNGDILSKYRPSAYGGLLTYKSTFPRIKIRGYEFGRAYVTFRFGKSPVMGTRDHSPGFQLSNSNPN